MNKKILYIDCDGVIFNTINEAYKMMEEEGLDHTNRELANQYFKDVDWHLLIGRAGILNDSIRKIKMIIKSNNFKDVKILTKLCGNETEELAKRIAFAKLLPGIEVITVALDESKAEVVCAKGDILVDDYFKNVNDWHNHNGIGILYDIENDNSLNSINDLGVLSNRQYVKRITRTRNI